MRYVAVLMALLLVEQATSAARVGAETLQETDDEFIARADLTGDEVPDIVLVDKRSGRIRLGQRVQAEPILWMDWRESGLTRVSGFSVGRFFAASRDSLAFASMDDNALALLDIPALTESSVPAEVPFLLLGPALVEGLRLSADGGGSLHDLFVGSVYNAPDENMASLFRNREGLMEDFREFVLSGVPIQCQRVPSTEDQSDLLILLQRDAGGYSLHVHSFGDQVQERIWPMPEITGRVRFTVTATRRPETSELLVWAAGSSAVHVRSMMRAATGEVTFGPERVINLTEAIKTLAVFPVEGRLCLFVVHADGATAGLYTYGEDMLPELIQTIRAADRHLFTGALPLEDGLITFQAYASGGPSVRYQRFKQAHGAFTEGVYGRLPSLADQDESTVPMIHARILARPAVREESGMRTYTNTIPGTDIRYTMVPVPGGEFLMGSPEHESGRQPDEGPQRRVRVDPFWMGQCEVTWNEFELFMYPDEEKRLRELHPSDEAGDTLADAVTHPSRPYTDMTFGMGRQGYPAIGMTQHAANKYCQWLSAKTGQFHRLPTEAEWEYAARASTTTAYFFGDDPSALADYAWYEMNSDFRYQKVGRKLPSPWGLHDIYGNVLEWVLDQYDPAGYDAVVTPDRIDNPWVKPTRPYPLAVRGGSWDDTAEACRSAARRGSDPVWKLQDPQLPKSTWYFTDADFVGFRVVRPLTTPSASAMEAYWNNGVERE